MFDDVPTRAWLLILIGIAALVPARYLVDHLVHSPSRRDITRPAEDLSWRTPGRLVRNGVIVVALAAIATFIFTPAAERFARSPSFVPVLLAALGGWSMVTVVKGHLAGRIEPMVRGASWVFERATQPKRFWASMAWNGSLGALFVFLSYQSMVEAPRDALRERCYDRDDRWSPKDELAACDQLLADDGDSASVIAARGSAFYRAGRYDRAMADYSAAVRLDPRQSHTHYNIRLIHDLRGERWRAVRAYGAAIRADPENAGAYGARGQVFLDKGQVDLAVADFTRAHALSPGDVTSLANRGISYAWKGDAARARRDFAGVPRDDAAAYPVVLRGEALLAAQRGDDEGALRWLTAAIDRDPADAWSLSRRAALYRKAGETAGMRTDVAALATLSARGKLRE